MDRIKTVQFPSDPIVANWIRESDCRPLSKPHEIDPCTVYVGRLSNTAALAVLIYEKFLILEEEIELVWCKRKSWITVLYFFNSWLAPLWIAFQISVVVLEEPSAVTVSCIATILGRNVVTLLMTLSVQTAMQLRVWAIYERSRKILWFLMILLCIECAAMVTLMAIMIADLDMLPIISTPFGCAFEVLPHYSSLFWVPAIVIEPILCVLVLRKALGLLGARTGLSALLARDSLIYFFAVFTGLLSILVAWLIDPLNIVYFFPWVIAFPSLLGCRLLLNIRRHFESGPTWEVIEMTHPTPQVPTGAIPLDDANVPVATHP
ncbi:hypothetical protein EDC04DRAFT_428252 [Pisolithus marmoratus]|nr:hypothetical protein EDC04DRAFT_1043855 [Pisolithus marmoratus]KAI6044334.1 hypothetical protein EDC04DRAFT_428252 [Pisolithus marmoratus]